MLEIVSDEGALQVLTPC